MRPFRLQPRHLVLLALFQLVAGPLMLLQVTVFCSLTARETPQQGVAKAVVKAWHSDAFQSLLALSDEGRVEKDHGSLPPDSGKFLGAKAKLNMVVWQLPPVEFYRPCVDGVWDPHLRAWTPSWPQAPPGTPPRQS